MGYPVAAAADAACERKNPFTSTGTILVLFILLVIITRTIW